MNRIFSTEEYLAQGFTMEEVAKVRRSDELYNNFNNLTEAEREEYFKLCEELGL